MKKLLSIFLIAIVTLASCRMSCLFMAYAFNYDFIKTTLCVNKTAPEKHCNGKCHLTKQLKQEEKQESKMPEMKTGNEILFHLHQGKQPFFVTALREVKFFYNDNSSHSGFVTGVFRPPSVAG